MSSSTSSLNSYNSERINTNNIQIGDIIKYKDGTKFRGAPPLRRHETEKLWDTAQVTDLVPGTIFVKFEDGTAGSVLPKYNATTHRYTSSGFVVVMPADTSKARAEVAARNSSEAAGYAAAAAALEDMITLFEKNIGSPVIYTEHPPGDRPYGLQPAPIKREVILSSVDKKAKTASITYSSATGNSITKSVDIRLLTIKNAGGKRRTQKMRKRHSKKRRSTRKP